MEDPHARRLVPNRGGGLEWAGAGLSRLASLPLSSDVVHILSKKLKSLRFTAVLAIENKWKM
jgi:hypothetical protein